MPKFYCFCEGCESGRTKNNEEWRKKGMKAPSLFVAPKDPETFEQWKKAIPKIGSTLTEKDRVCSLHFKEQDLQSYFEVKLPDGVIWRTKRDRKILKKGAVPSIFSNHCIDPTTYNKSTKQQKILNLTQKLLSKFTDSCEEPKYTDYPEKTDVLDNTKSNKESSKQDASNTQQEISNTNSCTSFTFKNLKYTLIYKIERRSWSSTVSEDSIIFSYYSFNIIERWIIIGKDLVPKVFIKGIETKIAEDVSLVSINDIYGLMTNVEKVLLCDGINNNSNCMGYLCDQYSNKVKKCKSCRLQQNFSRKRLKKQHDRFELVS